MNAVPGLAPLEDACTVVLLRDGSAGLETLLLERPAASSSFGGAWVFPGGKVDPADRLAARNVAARNKPATTAPGGVAGESDPTAQLDLTAAQVAGLREVAEETGQQIHRDQLVWLAQWTPMQAIPRRFRTWFMLAPAASEKVVLNPAEHQKFQWLQPATALELHARGEMRLVPPTWVTLHNLLDHESTAQALAAAQESTPFAYETRLLPAADGSGPAGVLWAGDEAYSLDSDADAASIGAASGALAARQGPAAPEVPAGSRHRLTTASLPWSFERSTPASHCP